MLLCQNSQILFFFVKVLSDRMTISPRLFLEKRAILLIFVYNDKNSTNPIQMLQVSYPRLDYILNS